MTSAGNKNTPAPVMIHREAAEYLLKICRAAASNLERHRAKGTYGPDEAAAAGRMAGNCERVCAYLESRMRAAEFEAMLTEVAGKEGARIQAYEISPFVEGDENV